jgi:predicted ATPase/signal transduction histidine kinase
MTQDPGYLLEVMRAGGEFTLYRGRRASAPPVLALTITARQPSQQSLERLAHEYALATDLDPTWAVRPLALTRQDGLPMLLLEDHGAEPLDPRDSHTGDPRRELPHLLRVAGNLAHAIGQMHQQGLVHKDIKPSNVLVDDAGHVRLTGFGIASRLRRERQVLAPPEIIAGTFAYMAPEQTGRMNRSVDARSDLYSFGVTLYELLTGTLPFTASDPMEWIHCHIARRPLSPSERASELPAAISDIVLKLLAKNPEDRYQTAAGVETDLLTCLTALETDGRILTFPLGQHDVPDRLVMPEKLYGRKAEIDVLLTTFERVVNQGSAELVLVSGYAGIGKSSIVHELHKVLVPSRGLFAAGKFDQYKRDIPYATLAEAFQGLVRQLLNKNDEELAVWREAFSAALGPNGQLMVNLIPELALVIGEQPPLPRVEPHEASARFHRVFRNLLGVFAQREHPLVLFIDDLQWLDAGTLELLQRLITEPDSRHLLLIGAYRDNEVGPTHPLATTIAAIRAAGGAVSEVSLAPLQVEHVAQLAAEALHTNVERAGPLAALVFEKTGGNPFFAIQFITALADEGLVTFDSENSSWQWDIERIRAKGITDNVADLMAAKLSRLPVATREALGQLGCLGNVAHLATVALARGTSEREVQTTLADAVEAGLILRVNSSFAFIHDRVHEAAYALIPNRQRAAAHLHIARALFSLTPAAELEEKIFEIVNHFERGAPAIESAPERNQVAELNLIAGKRAKTSSAYGAAQAYFSAGRALLEDGSWERQYRLTFELELHRAECEIVGGELAIAEARLSTLSQHAVGIADQADVVCLAVRLCFTTGRSERAVEVALGFLSSVGIHWSARPTEAEVRQEYVEMHRNLARRTIGSLIDLPEMSDPECIATMAVLTELFPAAYAVDRYLLELVLLRMTNLSLEHGNCESSSVAYSALNMALGSHFSDYAAACSLGELACELVERRGMDRYKARVYSCFAAFSMPWTKHIPLCQPLMTQAFRIGSSMGDTAFAAYNARNLITHLLVSGMPLSQVQREAEQALAYASRVQLGLPAPHFIRQLELVQKLRRVFTERDAADDAWASQEVEHQPGLAMMVCYHWVFRLQEHFLAADFPAALEAAAHIEGIRWAMRSSIEEAEYDFYAALSHAASADGASRPEREQHVLALSTHYERIVIWAENCAENFANRKALVGAEISRLEGKDAEAQILYEQAVRLARKHGFLQNEAIANELAGKFYAARGLDTIADAYLRNARDCYERWGALSKVRALDARYPLRVSTLRDSLTATVDKPVAQLDVEVVDKASQTLSSEMVLPSLLEKLMRLAVVHAAAERGVLILLQDDVPHIEAEATSGRGSVEVSVRRLRVTPSDLPHSALQYVLRTHERLVLDDASAEGLDPNDVYVARNHPRSVLCVPIFKLTKVVGALYLENNLTTCAFTPDRVAVLDFLASQAAIALENARLYSELQRSEALLKQAQHLSSTGSFYWRVDSDVIEYSEQTYRMYAFSPGQPVTLQLMATRTHPEDLPLLREMIDRARGPGSDLDYLYRLQMPNLAIKHLHLVAHGTRAQDGGREYIGAIQDVTQRRQSEEALGKVRSELAHVARISSLGVLTASIAHEVNQPLTGIVTNASACLRMLAAEPPNLDGARETAKRMIRDGHRASDVIARLRALFARKSAPNELVNLNEATTEVIALAGSELRKNAVQLRVELAADLPPVNGDRIQLQQVILNLLINAVDAMRSVEDRPRQVGIRTQRDEGERVRVTVRDVGVGVDPQTVPRLFDAFYTTKSDGMGIGLSVSRSIIESHQGQLWSTRNDGPGSTFGFSLPSATEAVTPSGDGETGDFQRDR